MEHHVRFYSGYQIEKKHNFIKILRILENDLLKLFLGGKTENTILGEVWNSKSGHITGYTTLKKNKSIPSNHPQ